MNYSNSGTQFSYLIKTEIDKNYGVTVNTVGFQSVNSNVSYPAKEHPQNYYFDTKKGRTINEYQFVYLTKGIGELTFDSKERIAISKGQLIVIFPDQWHTYKPSIETGWDEYYIGFEGKIIDNLITNSFFFNENQVLNVGLNEELVNLFKRALEVAKLDRISSQQHLSGIVMHMIGLVLSESKDANYEIDNTQQIVENAKIIMNENVFEIIYPEELAIKLNVEYTKFRRIFKSYTGFSPAKYFQELKIKKGKQLLLESSYSIKEISIMLKYYSPESFNIAFRKRTGCPPSQYRLSCRKPVDN